MATEILSAQALRELLAYDADTGVFNWLVRPAKNIKAGAVAGCDRGDGYISIRVLGRLYLGHRIAWLHVHGMWPVKYIDHIDGNKSNNAIANLRDVSQSVNMQNRRGAQGNSTHGFLGVSRNGKRWVAQIAADSTRYCLGTFDAPEPAHAAYLEAKRDLHPGSAP